MRWKKIFHRKIQRNSFKNSPLSAHSALKDAGALRWKKFFSPLFTANLTLFFDITSTRASFFGYGQYFSWWRFESRSSYNSPRRWLHWSTTCWCNDCYSSWTSGINYIRAYGSCKTRNTRADFRVPRKHKWWVHEFRKNLAGLSSRLKFHLIRTYWTNWPLIRLSCTPSSLSVWIMSLSKH